MTEQPEQIFDFLAEQLKPAPSADETDALLLAVMPKIAALGFCEATRLLCDALAIAIHSDFPEDAKARDRLLRMFSGFVRARIGQLEQAEAALSILPDDIRKGTIQ